MFAGPRFSKTRHVQSGGLFSTPKLPLHTPYFLIESDQACSVPDLGGCSEMTAKCSHHEIFI